MYRSTKIKPLQRGSFIFMMTAISLIYALLAQTAYAVNATGSWQTATGVTVEKGSRVYDTANRVYYTLNKMTNNSGAPLSGPVRLVVTSSSFPVANATGTDANGKPYFDVLASGASLANAATGGGTRINFQSSRATFAYSVEVQKWVETVVDSDSDGIPDTSDNCPLDAQNDADGDGTCGNVDNCPLDAKNDEDGDGQCANVDSCPLDPQNDVDRDNICGNVDFCPTDASNSCVTVNGRVKGNGAVLSGVNIKIGTDTNNKTTVTDSLGTFSATGLGSAQAAHDNLNDFLPVEVSASGYSSGYAKVVLEKGKAEYSVAIDLQPVSDNFTTDDNLNNGVEINKQGAAVGQLTIPDSSLPDGVTEVTGTVTYLDPTTDDIQSAPGGDLLALPAGVDPNTATPVPLESFGMMEFDLKDQNGNPIHELGGTAEVCMKATPGLNAGDTIPLWYYDEATGLWKEQGQGTVADKNGQLMICGNVTHFTWWNYDQPINTHSCFKFDVRDETTGNRLSGNIDWQAEGVTYSGTSPERACSVDADDPNVGSTIDSLTVKKSDGSTIEKIRVFADIGGNKFYLKRDGDGTYSLTNQADATVFDNPNANASCLNNTNVDQCAFLDYLDGANADGILPLSANINYPPVISNFNITDANGAATSNLLVGASANVNATVTDPEGTNVKVNWSTECSWYEQGNPGTISPASQDFTASPALFNATYTAPGTLSYPVEWCRITATATDSDGMSSSAEQWVYVTGSYQYEVEGILYGTDGQPLPNTLMQYSNNNCNNNGSQEVTTDGNGHYSVQFNTQNCSGGEGYYDLGYMTINYSHDNTQRTRSEYLNNYYYSEINSCSVQANAATQCHHDIRLPTVWGSLSGNLYPPQGEAFQWLNINSYQYSYGYNGSDYTWIYFDQAQSSYGPISVPVGQGYMYGYTNTGSYDNSQNFMMPSTQGQHQDFGDATAPVTLTAFDGQGGVLPGISVTGTSYGCTSNNNCNTSFTGVTDNQGQLTSPLPLSQFYGSAVYPNVGTRYNYGYVTTKDQPVNLDINSPDSCKVIGVAYGGNGQPLGEGFSINAWSDGNYYYNQNWDGNLQAVTDANGQFVFTDVKPGYFYFTHDNYYFGYTNYSIDNCRPVNGSAREIRIDLPYFDTQYNNGLPY
ncbi:hypothetical protein IVG45_18580 [Methylomonas sp. LL1]|uniref:hypothetical protein n=1 Tax=Methylomonas sp. LL1 TaxID=2785785 RepID=UPI0018C39703|nr:hypothetical protein [Methylomonas sp. LL1]QPK62814.1 hypothetical protein IVG45_18580 [Methylomonas sp. LL1]